MALSVAARMLGWRISSLRLLTKESQLLGLNRDGEFKKGEEKTRIVSRCALNPES